MDHKATVVHVTHEAVGKIGGIGAVLDGIFTSKAYLEATGRSIIISPLFSMEGTAENRLGTDGQVLYSSRDGLVKSSYHNNFRSIENQYNVDIVYGRRNFIDSRTGIKSSPEVLLIDVTRIDPEPINNFKGHVFSEFGISSNLYEHIWEYEQWMRLGPPAIAALKAIGAAGQECPTVIISHEFMGMPTVLAAKLDYNYDFKTVFYAHEVATVRQIVENSPGHDTMFYNVMAQAQKENLYVSDIFGSQSHFFKHALVEASRFCDNILAVGDYVADELRFLMPEFASADIDITYNGIPAFEISLDEKLESRERLRQYCYNLLEYRPDFIFTHVTRLVKSKGLWRDLEVLKHIDNEFAVSNKTAVMFILSTEVCQRRSRDIQKMEQAYNWPVAHREGMPDMSGGETDFYATVQEFNAKCRNVKIVFINQFGFTQANCGQRMPEDMEFMDIRKGSDVEFGQSIYEPFGIAQFEPLSFGGICVVSSVCGCAGFIKVISNADDTKNVIIADYTQLGDLGLADIKDFKAIDKNIRKQIEERVSKKVAIEICARLPKNNEELTEMILSGYNLAKHMSWENVVSFYVLKSLSKAVKKNRDNLVSSYLRAQQERVSL